VFPENQNRDRCFRIRGRSYWYESEEIQSKSVVLSVARRLGGVSGGTIDHRRSDLIPGRSRRSPCDDSELDNAYRFRSQKEIPDEHERANHG
jgi:hypothetical protein